MYEITQEVDSFYELFRGYSTVCTVDFTLGARIKNGATADDEVVRETAGLHSDLLIWNCRTHCL